MTAPGEVLADTVYPSSAIGKEGTTFCLTKSAAPKAVLEIWHKVDPNSWALVGGHPSYADWHVSTAPPADMLFARGADPDGVWWLEEGAGRIWARVRGVWHWIYSIGSGRGQVYGGPSAPAAADGEPGDQWLDILRDAYGRAAAGFSWMLPDVGNFGVAVHHRSPRLNGAAAKGGTETMH